MSTCDGCRVNGTYLYSAEIVVLEAPGQHYTPITVPGPANPDGEPYNDKHIFTSESAVEQLSRCQLAVTWLNRVMIDDPFLAL